MKSSSKLSIALVFSISLLFSCSLLLWNANAQVSLQKVNLEDNVIRIQTEVGSPVIDVQLLENTDHCFTECYAILKIHPYQTITLPSGPDSEFAWNFVKDKPWMDGLLSYHFEILETTEYAVDVPDYGTVKLNTTCYDEQNQTYQCETNQTVQTGSHQETRNREEFRPFVFWGRTLNSETDYTIKIVGIKPISTQANNVDWIPMIKGLELREWEWWNTSWYKCRNITINANKVAGSLTNFPMLIILDNSTGDFTDVQSDWDDLRFVNSSCNNWGAELKYEMENYTSLNWTGWISVDSLNNTNDRVLSVYYDNPYASSGENKFAIWSLANVVAAYHLSTASDSTQNANNLTLHNSPPYVPGKIGSALNFSLASSQWASMPKQSYLQPTGNFAITTWVWLDGPATGYIFSNPRDDTGWPSWLMYQSTSYNFYTNDNNNLAPTNCGSVNASWRYVALVHNGTNQLMYIDNCLGNVTNVIGNVTYQTGENTINLGKNRDIGVPPDPGYMHGRLDEWRFYNTSVSYAYVNTTFNNQNSPSTFYSIGAEETPKPSPTIVIDSPKNLTYNVSSIDLNWSVDEQPDWAAYSLNEGTNITNIFSEKPVHLNSILPSNYIHPMSVFVAGKTAFVTDHDTQSLFSFNVSNSSQITLLDSINYGAGPPNYLSGANGIFVLDNIAYVAATNDYTLSTFNVSNPANIIHLGNTADYNAFNSVFVLGNIAYLTTSGLWGKTITTYNVTNPSNMIELGSMSDSRFCYSIYVSDQTAYVLCNCNDTFDHLLVYNVSNPSNIVKIDDVSGNDSSNYLLSPKSIFVTNGYAYVVSSSYADALTVFDVSDPYNVVHVGNISGAGSPYYLDGARSVFVVGDTAYVASELDHAVSIFRISDPSNITHINSITGYGSPNYIGYPYSLFVSEDVAYVVADYDNSLSSFDVSKKPQNKTILAQEGVNKLTIWANDTYGNMNSTTVYFTVDATRTITFNIYSGETGENLTNVNVNCNNSWSGTIDSFDTIEFAPGWWSCTFEKMGPPINYFNETIVFYADSDKTVNVIMNEHAYLTIQEHDWLHAVYDCLYTGDCLALNLLANINETTEKTWNQFKRTDQTIVTNEDFISTVVNSTNNITINYTINVPTKEGYGLIDGIQGYDDFLPVRISYWFLDENNESCYSQGNHSVVLAEPYCQPLTVYTVGQINTSLELTVDLRPSLPSGTYTIVRDIEIDPDSVWIDYGQEKIGKIQITENIVNPSTSVKGMQKLLDETYQTNEESSDTHKTGQAQTIGNDKLTGMITIQQIDSVSYIAAIVSVITLILVGLMFKNSRKRNP